MVSLDLSRVAENAALLSVLMTCASAWMEAALMDPDGGKRWMIYDEAWRLMAHPALLRRMDAQWRLARHYGLANMLVFHKLSDLDNVGDQGSAMRSLANSLLANAETRVIYRQESDQLSLTAKTLGLTGTEQHSSRPRHRARAVAANVPSSSSTRCTPTSWPVRHHDPHDLATARVHRRHEAKRT
jgi:type IV secretory pathway VirB4 component